jgi:predicted metalloprotease
MSVIPAALMPHVKRFGFSGAIAAGVVVVMMLGINPVTVLTGQVSPPPPPTSITGLPPADAPVEMIAAYPAIVGGEAELMWRRAFHLTAFKYPRISITVASEAAQFGCGMAGKDLTVFYCPDTQTVYADLEAYVRLRAKHPAGADHAMALLVAEAYGRHVQWKLEYFDQLVAMRGFNNSRAVEIFEQQLDQQATCYGAMWTITAGIDELYDMPAVLDALATVDANRQRAIIDLPEGKVIPESLAVASVEARRHWYELGYAIPAAGTCSLRKIQAAGMT